jgi:hypothetical protein
MSTPEKPRAGHGQQTIPRQLSVFINCPFDTTFAPIFDAIAFCTICCGFMPRSAIESRSAAIPRMERIIGAVMSSKYSIHDLSRSRGEGGENFARFNMPLELGIAMGERFRATSEEQRHDWLLLVPAGHSYKAFISDLAGYDPGEHSSTKESAIPVVMAWLTTRPDAIETPITPSSVLNALPEFESALDHVRTEWKGHAPWRSFLKAGLRTAEAAGLIPNLGAA